MISKPRDTTKDLLADAAPEAAAALLINEATSLVTRASRLVGAAHMKRSFKIERSPNGSTITPVVDVRAEQLKRLQGRIDEMIVALDTLATDLTTEAERHT